MNPTDPPMDPQRFLTALWGDPPPGVINIWRLPDRTSSWHRELSSINNFLRQFAMEEVYTGVSLSDPQKGRFTTRNRIEEAAAGAIAGVWSDIDVFHEVHAKATRLPGTREEAQEVMAQLPHEPTIIVDSGHGLQYWWLLTKPWVFAGEEEWGQARRMVQWWHKLTKDLMETRGWTTDSVYDLSRILRIPGTFNNKVKNDRKEVMAISADGPRYSIQDFLGPVPEDFEASAPAPEQRRNTGSSRSSQQNQTSSTTSSGLTLDPGAEPGAVRLQSLLKADKKFQRTWEKNRPDLKDQSASSYNMSLADIAVRAGWDDQEVVNLMICWRRMHGHDLKLRERYYELTLARAKEPIRAERAQRTLEETLIQPPEDEEEVLKDNFRDLFGVDIKRVVKYLGDPPFYHMYTEQGDITLGTIDKIYSQAKFREAVGAATDIVIAKVSGTIWDKRIQAILQLCEPVDVGDASHPAQETRTWVHDYLIDRYVREEEDRDKAIERRFPYLEDGLIRIFLEDLSKWLDVTLVKKMDTHTLGRRMRMIHAAPERVNVRIAGARTTRSVWILPDEFQPPQQDPGMGPGQPADEPAE